MDFPCSKNKTRLFLGAAFALCGCGASSGGSQGSDASVSGNDGSVMDATASRGDASEADARGLSNRDSGPGASDAGRVSDANGVGDSADSSPFDDGEAGKKSCTTNSDCSTGDVCFGFDFRCMNPAGTCVRRLSDPCSEYDCSCVDLEHRT
jgi:hypothetical protein